MVSMSADGQVIGQRAGHLYHPESDVSTGAILIDDPLKAADERYANRVNSVNENYSTTIASRLAHESVPIILIMQRLHYNDMSSFLLNGGSGEYWHHLSLPVEIPVEPPKYKFSHGIPIPHNLPPGPLWRQKFDETAIAALKTQRRRYRTQYKQDPPRVDEDDTLWTEDLIARARSIRMPECTRTVVAVDPAASNNEHSDLNGIIVAGRASKNQFTVFEDFSLKSSPKRWAKRAMLAYKKYSAIGIVVEVNMGGDMVADTLRNAGFRGRIIEVRASKGKVIRADPVSALYEMRYVSHAEGLGELEDEMLSFSSLTGLSDGVSPNRLDALVWALTYLAGGGVALGKLLESAINQNSTDSLVALG